MNEPVESDNCSLSAKRVTYFMTGLNLVSGVINFILGVWKVKSLLIVGGIISTFGGAILLIGIIKDSARYILVYLILQTIIFALGTIFGLLLMLVMVTVASQLLESQENVKIGNMFVINSDLIALAVFVILVLIIVSWIVQFLIYIFYDDVVTRNKAAARSRAQSSVVAYDAVGGDSASNITFIRNDIN